MILMKNKDYKYTNISAEIVDWKIMPVMITFRHKLYLINYQTIGTMIGGI